MPTKKQFQTRLDPDDARQVEQYAEDHDVTTAEAVRRLVRAGLDAAQSDYAERDEIRDDLRQILDERDDQDDDDDNDRELHVMSQMDGDKIVAIALGIALGGYVTTHLPPVGLVRLVALLLVGIALVGYGAAPLLANAPDSSERDATADAPSQ